MQSGRRAFKLNELGFVGRGKSKHRPRNDPSLYGGEYPFFQTGDIKAAQLYVREAQASYNEKGLAQSKLWQPGTLCITIAANIAETAILGVPGCFPDSVVGFVPDPSRADVHYIKYHIDTIKLAMQSASRGTTQDNLSVDKLLTFDLHVPPLCVQRRIAAILSAYDALIENNTRRIAILEEMARGLYEEWFVKFRFPGHEKTKMVESEVGLMPNGWAIAPLAELTTKIGSGATPTGGKGAYRQDGISLIRSLNVYDYNFDDDDLAHIDDVQAKKLEGVTVEPRDVLLNITGASVGRCCMVPDAVLPARVNQHVSILRADLSRIDACYLLMAINGAKHKGRLLAMAQGGATREALTKDTLERFKIEVPPPTLIATFAAYLEPAFALREVLRASNIVLRASRDLLIPKLVSGQLDLAVVDTPEPVEAA